MLPGLQEIYSGIPEQYTFDLLASFSGAIVHLTEFKVTAQYGVIKAESYAEAANKRYNIYEGTWVLK